MWQRCPGRYTNRKCSHSNVPDSDHLSGAYRSAAYSKCNLNLRITFKISAFIHIFRSNDSQLIVPGLTQFKGMVMQVIGHEGLEKYTSVTSDDAIVFKGGPQSHGGRLEAPAERPQ